MAINQRKPTGALEHLKLSSDYNEESARNKAQQDSSSETLLSDKKNQTNKPCNVFEELVLP